MSRPLRRPFENRPRPPAPFGLHADSHSHARRALTRWMDTLNKRLYPGRPGLWLRRRLEQGRVFRRVDLGLERGGPGLGGLRIAFLSDLHAGAFMSERDLCGIFERVARLEPDLVCLGGDLVENRAEQILMVGKALGLLQPPLGIFAVPGNHDRDAEPGLERWSATLEEHGVHVLLNSGERLKRERDSLWIAGVDDLARGLPDLPQALRGVREDEPIVLLSHHPDLFIEAAHVGVDLTLSGHTHAGQITLRGYTPLKHTRLGYWCGHYEVEGAHLYVGGGVGITGLPLRIHAPSEVPLVQLWTGDRQPVTAPP